MPWLTRLAAMLRRNRGHRLGDLENRVVELERRLAVTNPTVPEAPAKKMGNRRAQAGTLLDQGLSQAAVARRLGVSRQYIHQLVHKGL
ncbi:MAG: helix-turn-helix domain containing protein [Proteobacteria bacterium]|nr:helix-turn-helix domain containing protein [Pseudomonadota bacterium]